MVIHPYTHFLRLDKWQNWKLSVIMLSLFIMHIFRYIFSVSQFHMNWCRNGKVQFSLNHIWNVMKKVSITTYQQKNPFISFILVYLQLICCHCVTFILEWWLFLKALILLTVTFHFLIASLKMMLDCVNKEPAALHSSWLGSSAP